MKTNVLAERAMLVSLNVSEWAARRKDKEVGEEVTETKKADKDAGAWWTQIVSRKELHGIRASVVTGRQTHDKMTLPWDDSGTRILPSARFMEYTKAMRDCREVFEREVEAFLAKYPQLVKAAADRLGDLFDPKLYPAVKQLRDKFAWGVSISPMPQAADFRVDLGADVTEDIKKQIEADVMANTFKATRYLWDQLYEKIERITERLGDPDAIFRDSLIENLNGLCDLLPKMNIAGDPNLEKMRQEVAKKLASQKPDDLRADKKARKETAKTAKDILAQMESFMGGKPEGK